jgi:hypothetical protein
VARQFGLTTGEWLPLGSQTEGGPCPEFAALYGAREMAMASDPATRRSGSTRRPPPGPVRRSRRAREFFEKTLITRCSADALLNLVIEAHHVLDSLGYPTEG